VRKSLSDHAVRELKPRAKRYAVPDPELRGHYVRVAPSGFKAFVVAARGPSGKQVWATIGAADALGIGEARERARAAILRIRDGEPPFAEPVKRPETFAEVAATWCKRHVDAKGLRSGHEIRRQLRRHVLPAWGGRPFVELRRSDIAELLDAVEDGAGARSADYILAIVRGIANWYAARHDTYQPPFVRGMRRSSPKERERKRVLDDDELRAVWQASATAGAFGALVKLALLTGQRSAKIRMMRWEDIGADGVWRIPAARREKGNGGELRLPPLALAIIQAQPRCGDNPYVLAVRGDGPLRGIEACKRRLDAETGVAGWTVHDLRRTARSLMARAGVRPDIAERVMGHAIGGVEGIYNRHQHQDEKATALAALAGLIERIIGANVVALRG
jgi:integrase